MDKLEAQRITYNSENLLRPSDALKKEYMTTPYRFLVVVFYFFTIVCTSVFTTAFAAAFNEIATAYNVPVIDATMTSIVFNLTYIPMTFVSIWSFREYSRTINFRVVGLTLLMGAWIREFAGDNFGVVLLGQTIVSLTYPFLLSSVTLVCYTWLNA